MRSIARFFLWFLLVPYFAVRSLNVRPWFAGQREVANRTNAQLAVALIFSAIFLGVLSISGEGHLLDHVSPYLFGIAAVVPPMAATAMLLNRHREKEYWSAYKSMPEWKRGAFGLGTLAFVAVMLLQVPIKHPPERSPSKNISCDKPAAEVSAEACSAE
jgi:hypothetical protein